MNTKPIIGIAPNYSYEKKEYTLSEDYVLAIEKAGGCPIVLLPHQALPLFLDGLLLTGGGDIDPLLFGEEPLCQSGEINPLRDACEMRICETALEKDLPMLGICRGMQVMNIVKGGGRISTGKEVRSMDVINDLTSSLSSDLNSTELAKDLGLGFLAKSTAINGAVNLGIKLLEILFTLFLCWLMIRISSKLVNKFLRTQVQREKLSMSERKAKTLSTVTGSILKYVIYFIGLMSILKQLGVSSESLVVIASAGSVAIGLGAQSIAGDMMEGFFILFEDHYAVGDIVTIQGITGTVESVTLRSTKLRDFGGAVHIIPNGSIGTVTNNCREFINAVVTVGIAYGESIDRAIAVLQDEMQKTADMEAVLETPTVAGVIGLDDSAVTIKIVAKCKVKMNYAVEAELRRRIKNRFDAEGIEIPFPQQVVHLMKEA